MPAQAAAGIALRRRRHRRYTTHRNGAIIDSLPQNPFRFTFLYERSGACLATLVCVEVEEALGIRCAIRVFVHTDICAVAATDADRIDAVRLIGQAYEGQVVGTEIDIRGPGAALTDGLGADREGATGKPADTEEDGGAEHSECREDGKNGLAVCEIRKEEPDYEGN